MKLNNGYDIPQIGVGTWTLKGETCVENVKLALQKGFRLVDTAQMYENEAEVGEGIHQSGVPREEIFLTTKINTSVMRLSREEICQAIDESISKLKTPYVDLLLIHWPVANCIKKTWQIMEEYVKEGKVRSIGVSNFNKHHLQDLMEYAEIRPALNQIEVHPFLSQEENISFNKSLEIQVQAWGPFGQGDIDTTAHPTILELARKYGKTPSQIVLRWIIQRNLITIPRAKPNHFQENLEIMTFSMDESDMKLMNAININLRSNKDNDPENFPW